MYNKGIYVYMFGKKNIYIYYIYIIHPYVYINPAQPFLYNFHFPSEPGVLYPLLPWQPGSNIRVSTASWHAYQPKCRSFKWTQIIWRYTDIM